MSTPVKVLQLPPPPAVSPIRLMRTVEVGNWFLLEVAHASAHRCKLHLCHAIMNERYKIPYLVKTAIKVGHWFVALFLRVETK